MKNYELLDLIGNVDEGYVLAADSNVARPRFRWQAIAACAALVLGAVCIYRAVNPALHDYTVVEGGILETQDGIKAPAGGADIPMPGGAYVGDDRGSGMDGVNYGEDAPVQEEAAAQYDSLLKNGGFNEAESAPEWYGGAWIDNDWPDHVGRLTVAIVDGFRTPELEAQIADWCGGTGDVLFCGAKYSQAHLYALQEPVVDALDGTGLACGIGVDVAGNCLGVDLYSEEAIPNGVLAALARLDPDGDAIRVRVFAGTLSTTDEVVKGPAPEPKEPVDPEAYPTPIDESEWEPPVVPGGVSDPAGSLPGGAREQNQPALTEDGYNIPGAVNELPGAKHDALYGEEG